jgi:hypothetical protein
MNDWDYFLEWLASPYAAGTIVALAIGLLEIRRRKLPSILLILAGLLQACLMRFNTRPWHVRNAIKEVFSLPGDVVDLALIVVKFVPLTILLCAVFYARTSRDQERSTREDPT